jgi:PKD repeat protein
LYAVFILAAVLLLSPVMAAGTTSVHIVKYANDNTTILNETTVNYTWMEANLPVLGDGSTHYYSQGPTFNDSDIWDDAEWQNIVPDRDWGAVKGTDVKDLCNLVGGMSAGERVKIKASDGFSKTFPYEYIYTPNPRQGPMGITWYRSDDGYVPNYSNGMRLVMFADAKIDTFGWNTSGWHVFGNADMRDSWAPEYWANFSGTWPSSGQASIKTVSDILIYSNTPAPLTANFTANVTTGQVPLTVQFNDTSTGGPTSWAWDFFNDGTIDSNVRNPVFTYPVPGNYTVNLTVTNAGGSDSEVKTKFIHVTTIPPLNVIYNGTVTLSGGNFTWTDYKNGNTYTASNLTPHGAIDTASLAGGFTYGDTYKSTITGAIIDWINSGSVNYTYNGTPSPKLTWN